MSLVLPRSEKGILFLIVNDSVYIIFLCVKFEFLKFLGFHFFNLNYIILCIAVNFIAGYHVGTKVGILITLKLAIL